MCSLSHDDTGADERQVSAVITSVDDGTTPTDEGIDQAAPGAHTAGVAPDAVQNDDSDDATRADKHRRLPRVRWARVIAFGVLPGLSLALAAGAGYLKWQYDSARDAAAAETQSVAAATESTIALLSYQPDTAEKQLAAARDRLTGTFRDSYTSLIHDVVIPGARQKQISAVATVPAAAPVSATPTHAVVLIFVDQSITAGTDAPTSSASSVKVALDKVGERWLISDFTPV
jgi:Mce-associated membrane protein